MTEIETMKQRYAHKIEDGKKIEAFTTMPEWQWFVKHVLEPTCQEYTDKIMTGAIESDKEDWITRGMIMGMRLVIDTPKSFESAAKEAKVKAKELDDYLAGTE